MLAFLPVVFGFPTTLKCPCNENQQEQKPIHLHYPEIITVIAKHLTTE
jgi:hypothetical protein